jgi:hypothetical protein
MAIISECTTELFTLLKSKEVVIDNSTIEDKNCRFELPVFAYTSDTTDTYKNDFTSSLLALSNRYNTPELYLEKEDSCDSWTEIAQLTDSTYGEYFTFTAQPNWIGYRIDWHLVYTLEGVGCYRIRQEYTDITDSSTKVNYSFKYNLNLYTDGLADKTTKIKYIIRGGIIGSTQDDSETIDYKNIIWEREIRLPLSYFGNESSEFTREYVRYKNGAQVWTQDDQVETIQYNARRVPYTLHRELKITAMQSDEIYISDYNESNPNESKYDAKRVIPTSDYSPVWGSYTPYAPISLTFSPYYKNLERKRC